MISPPPWRPLARWTRRGKRCRLIRCLLLLPFGLVLTTLCSYYELLVSSSRAFGPANAQLVRVTDYCSAGPSADSDLEDARRIFFHETSGRSALNMVQSCAVESAALRNPDRAVQLFIQSNSLDRSGGWFRTLAAYSNVHVIVIGDGSDYFRDTPFEAWYLNGRWKTSPHRVAHMADYIRIASLYKGGGMFLDLDVVTLRAYSDDIFTNFFQIESAQVHGLANGMIHLEKGHRFIGDIAQMMTQEYDPDAYVYNGPDVITELMQNKCGFVSGRIQSNRCTDIRLLPHDYFFPFGGPFWGELFKDGDKETMAGIYATCYGVHVYNFMSKNESVDVSAGSSTVFAQLARKNCPLTVSNFQL